MSDQEGKKPTASISSLLAYRAERDFPGKEERLYREFRLRVRVGKLAADPTDYDRYNDVGLSLLDLEIYDEAEIYFRRALALNLVDGNEEDISVISYNLAAAILDPKNPAKNREVVGLLRKCIEIQQDLPDPNIRVITDAAEHLGKLSAEEGPAFWRGFD